MFQNPSNIPGRDYGSLSNNVHTDNGAPVCSSQLLCRAFPSMSVANHTVNFPFLTTPRLALRYQSVHAEHQWSIAWVAGPDCPAHRECWTVQILRVDTLVLETGTRSEQDFLGAFTPGTSPGACSRSGPPGTDCDVSVVPVRPSSHRHICQYVGWVKENVVLNVEVESDVDEWAVIDGISTTAHANNVSECSFHGRASLYLNFRCAKQTKNSCHVFRFIVPCCEIWGWEGRHICITYYVKFTDDGLNEYSRQSDTSGQNDMLLSPGIETSG